MVRSVVRLLLVGFLLIPGISDAALNLGVSNSGVSLGNSKVWHGLRFNLADKDVEQIDGLNVILGSWGTHSNRDARYRGLACGLLRMKGRSIKGLTLVGFDTLVSGPVRGLALAGGVECESFAGVSVTWVGGFASEHLSGINIGGMAEIVNVPRIGNELPVGGRIRGLTVAGLAVLCDGSVSGITGAFGVVGGRSITGVSVAGVCVVADPYELTGLSVGGLVVHGERAACGINVAGIQVDARELKGLGVASYVHAQQARGLTIAVFNRVDELHGVELGLLNFAGNNSGVLRWLPVVNAHF